MTSLSTRRDLSTDGLSGIALVMLAAGLWATVGVAVQMTPGATQVPDTLLAAARTGIGGPVLLASWFFAMRGKLAELRGLSLRPLAVFGVASSAFQICLFRCFDQLGVTVAIFLTVCLPPVLGAAWAALAGGGRLSWTGALALAVALAGMALVALGGPGADEMGVTLSGLANGIGASVAFVAMSLAAANLSRKAPAIVVAGAGLTLSAVLLTAMVIASGAWQGMTTDLSAASPATLVVILYLGLLPTALAYLCYCRGMAKCRTPVVGLVASMVEPVLAAFLAALLVHEAIVPVTWVGCLLLMGAMVLLWREER